MINLAPVKATEAGFLVRFAHLARSAGRQRPDRVGSPRSEPRCRGHSHTHRSFGRRRRCSHRSPIPDPDSRHSDPRFQTLSLHPIPDTRFRPDSTPDSRDTRFQTDSRRPIPDTLNTSDFPIPDAGPNGWAVSSEMPAIAGRCSAVSWRC